MDLIGRSPAAAELAQAPGPTSGLRLVVEVKEEVRDPPQTTLAVDVHRLRLQTLVIVSVLTGTAVCFTGAIGFVGLLAPHAARMTVGEDQRFLVPLAGLYGALLVSAAAVASKAIVPGVVFPIGIATASLGAPFFVLLALSNRRGYW